MGNIQNYRQPLVTATGIFLGFMLNFANGWMPGSFTSYRIRDSIIAVGSMSSIALLIVVLYRILRMIDPPDVNRFYKRTLFLFILGISIPFLTMVVIVFRKLALNFL
jgi:hypothetical protein